MKTLWLAFLLFATAVSAHADQQLPAIKGVPPRLEADIIAIMEKIQVLDAEIKNEPPRDLIDYLRQVANKQSGALNIFLVLGDRTPEAISVTFANESFRSALDKICEKSHLNWWISRQALVIGPRSYHEKKAPAPGHN
jgi:hypothetical protein